MMLEIPRDYSEVELRRLVVAIFHNKVFTSSHVKDHTYLPGNFKPMRGWTVEEKMFANQHISFIFEDMDSAVSLLADGTPVFMTLQTMHAKDSERLQVLFDEYRTWHNTFTLEPTHAGSDTGIPS